MNWKTIRKSGNFFSSFEDPFHIRQDIISYIIEISLIIVLICAIINTYYDILIVSSCFRIMMYFLSGFTAIIFE